MTNLLTATTISYVLLEKNEEKDGRLVRADKSTYSRGGIRRWWRHGSADALYGLVKDPSWPRGELAAEPAYRRQYLPGIALPDAHLVGA